MRFENAYLPAGGYWSSPFCKWQGSFSQLHPVEFAADVTRKALAARGVAATELDALVFGWTVPARRIFYGGPWLAGLVGAPSITGAMVSQACATSVAALAHAAQGIDAGASGATDRSAASTWGSARNRRASDSWCPGIRLSRSSSSAWENG